MFTGTHYTSVTLRHISDKLMHYRVLRKKIKKQDTGTCRTENTHAIDLKQPTSKYMIATVVDEEKTVKAENSLKEPETSG